MFADYPDETGDPARAEFIRVQVNDSDLRCRTVPAVTRTAAAPAGR